MKKVTILTGNDAAHLSRIVNKTLEELKNAELMSMDLASLTAAIQYEETERKMATDCKHCIDCIYFAEHGERALTGWCSFFGNTKRKDKRAFTCKHFSDEYQEV